MPTIIRQDGFEIRIYINDHDPAHVHAFKAGGQAKVNLGDQENIPSLMLVQGMSLKEAQKAVQIVATHQAQLLEKWEEFHG